MNSAAVLWPMLLNAKESILCEYSTSVSEGVWSSRACLPLFLPASRLTSVLVICALQTACKEEKQVKCIEVAWKYHFLIHAAVCHNCPLLS